jgi:hypothetical protein
MYQAPNNRLQRTVIRWRGRGTHFIAHTRRAGLVVVRPLNFGVSRYVRSHAKFAVAVTIVVTLPLLLYWATWNTDVG